MDSILQSIKKLIGVDSKYTEFDTDIIMHINSVFIILNQLGAGPEKGFFISDETSIWSDFIPEKGEMLETVKTYMYLKVKMIFDPPMSTAVLEAMKQMIKELEWRINVQAEHNIKYGGHKK